MKERPIIFNGPMVRAILEGRKMQTRRVVKPEGAHHLFQFRGTTAAAGADEPTGEWAWCGSSHVVNKHIRCPYGQPGDRLWVRESFDFLPSGGPDQPTACEIVYWSTGSTEPRQAPSNYNPMIYGHQKIRPSIHMPRWASRITLEITGVRVERLQDISEADAIAEGIQELIDAGVDHDGTPRDTFRKLWESINGPGSWDANPWVWVVEFKRIESGAAQ